MESLSWGAMQSPPRSAVYLDRSYNSTAAAPKALSVRSAYTSDTESTQDTVVRHSCSSGSPGAEHSPHTAPPSWPPPRPEPPAPAPPRRLWAAAGESLCVILSIAALSAFGLLPFLSMWAPLRFWLLAPYAPDMAQKETFVVHIPDWQWVWRPEELMDEVPGFVFFPIVIGVYVGLSRVKWCLFLPLVAALTVTYRYLSSKHWALLKELNILLPLIGWIPFLWPLTGRWSTTLWVLCLTVVQVVGWGWIPEMLFVALPATSVCSLQPSFVSHVSHGARGEGQWNPALPINPI